MCGGIRVAGCVVLSDLIYRTVKGEERWLDGWLDGWMRQALSVEAVMQQDCVWHGGRGRMLALQTLHRVHRNKEHLRLNLLSLYKC